LVADRLECSLTEVAVAGCLEVFRDGRFGDLGFLSQPLAGMLTFVDDERYLQRALHCASDIACVISTVKLADRLAPIHGLAVSENPRRSFYAIHNHLASTTSFYGDDAATSIHPSARVHPRAYIDERNVHVEADAVIGPQTTVLEGSRIGRGARVEAATVVGATGFQSIREQPVVDMVHAGQVYVEEGAVVLSNSVLARAVFRQATRIGPAAHIGSLVFVSHNVQIGERTFVGHGATLAGNVWVGADAWIGPGATILNNVRIGDKANVSLGAVVVGDVEDGRRVSGNFSIDHRRYLRHIAGLR